MNHLNNFGSSTCEILKLGRPKELGLVNLRPSAAGRVSPEKETELIDRYGAGKRGSQGKKRKDYGKGPNPTGYHASRHPVHAVQSLPAPPHGRESYGVQDAPKYCEYHRNSTHNTSECVTLKKEMDQLIARGPPPRSVNVMYNNTFKELGLSRSDLKPIHTPLSGFTGDTIDAEGTITVKAGVGDGTHRLWVDMEFMVVQLDCAHHLILGRPGLEDLECVISPVHLCLKFNTPTGVGVAKGNQSLSRSCYARATKSQARVDENVSTICAAIQKEEGRPRAEPAEEVEEVSLNPVEPERKVKVGKTLPLELKEQLLEVLRAFKVLFAWGPEDMPGVDPKIICHRLDVDPTHKPVKQKKRFLSSERREFVTKQVTTLQSIGWQM
ncbi:unnamed protein product [Cuscuta campestris]|uniref:Reverse transcriptase domain-containing protein n=1 Tax=Cuscuta campestris TaxID=132261 RepID=A0A484N875_9ASTE|nr:unnamed protein product [Cuscuta campestris]